MTDVVTNQKTTIQRRGVYRPFFGATLSPNALFLDAFILIILWERKIVRDWANCFRDGSQTTVAVYS